MKGLFKKLILIFAVIITVFSSTIFYACDLPDYLDLNDNSGEDLNPIDDQKPDDDEIQLEMYAFESITLPLSTAFDKTSKWWGNENAKVGEGDNYISVNWGTNAWADNKAFIWGEKVDVSDSVGINIYMSTNNYCAFKIWLLKNENEGSWTLREKDYGLSGIASDEHPGYYAYQIEFSKIQLQYPDEWEGSLYGIGFSAALNNTRFLNIIDLLKYV